MTADPAADGCTDPCIACMTDESHDPAPSTPAETDEQRADRLETEKAHAEGEHAFCGISCETELRTEHLRNFVVAKGYPGTRAALDELLRRARAEADAASAPADQPSIRDTMGPADGQQKMRLLDRLHANTIPVPALADQDLRGRIAQAVRDTVTRVMDLRGFDTQIADAVLAVLPAPADRAAVLREAATTYEEILQNAPDHAKDPRYWTAIRDVTVELRRMADEAQQAGEAAHRPCRGDEFERWLKAQRDAAADYPQAYQAADGLLDLYRLHADTGTLLDQHVCEGQAVGDCDCLEQPTVEARQADTAGEA